MNQCATRCVMAMGQAAYGRPATMGKRAAAIFFFSCEGRRASDDGDEAGEGEEEVALVPLGGVHEVPGEETDREAAEGGRVVEVLEREEVVLQPRSVEFEDLRDARRVLSKMCDGDARPRGRRGDARLSSRPW